MRRHHPDHCIRESGVLLFFFFFYLVCSAIILSSPLLTPSISKVGAPLRGDLQLTCLDPPKFNDKVAEPSVLSCPGRLKAAGQIGSEWGTRREALPGHFFWLGVLCKHFPYVRLSLGCERRAGGPVARGGKV